MTFHRRRPRFLWLSPAALLLLSCLAGCAKPDFGVPRGPHRPDDEPEPKRVSKPPPPASVEVIPLRRNDKCFYVDGYYEPAPGGWEWQDGSWVLPPTNCYYAPPTTQYEQVTGGTTLVHRPGIWLKQRGQGVCEAPQPCPRIDGPADSSEF